ncbi:MAG: DUF2185 domain-containing protein [Eubacterium sp.]|nr:DUF2185 domain-containing protein [Eubacterium sp.]
MDKDNKQKFGEPEGYSPELYSESELNVLEKHIEKHFGKFPNVFHEIFSPDIHVDICIIPPTKKQNFYTLVTMGMGAHKMNVPADLPVRDLERAELLITLPPDWKTDEQDEKWYWPIRALKGAARLPGESDTWLAYGHTIANVGPYAENTELCCVMLFDPLVGGDAGATCVLPGGEKVNFYQLIPLYKSEMDYKRNNGAGALADLMNKARLDFVVHIDRPNLTEGMEVPDPDVPTLDDFILDDAKYHLQSIIEKELPVDEINAYNHLAIYLRWFIEHDLIDENFAERFADAVQAVKEQGGAYDLRVLLRDNELLDGCLIALCFNDEGLTFSNWYYRSGDDAHTYPHDVDLHAEEYFGTERYNSDEFQDEAYLFVPFDERYYQEMSAIMEKKYEMWKSETAESQPQEKTYCISAEDIRPLLTDWQGANGCIASDRITVDGCKVGYCYREQPDPEKEDWDSGWRFLAGDESDEYINNANNSGIYALNTICNLDPDIMIFLNSPYGTAYGRDKDGFFKEEEFTPTED